MHDNLLSSSYAASVRIAVPELLVPVHLPGGTQTFLFVTPATNKEIRV